MTTVGAEYRRLYDDYYGCERTATWREIGAVEKAQNIVDLCSELKPQTVLEIGCGDATILARLSQLRFGSSYTGLDISATGIEAAKNRQFDIDATFSLFDGATVDAPDNSYDLAILAHVVEHLEHPRALIMEARRVAKYVFIEVPLEHTLRMKRDFAPNAHGHINFYTDRTIRRLVQTCGLEVLKQVNTDCSRETLMFDQGKAKGMIQHVIRRTALGVAPRLATYLFVYHSSLLCA